MKKRIISLLCVLAMLFALMCGAVSAAEDVVVIGEPVVHGSGWQQTQVCTAAWGGPLARDFLTEGGQLKIVVSGENIWSVHFIMQGDTNGWAQADKDVSALTDNGDGTYTATFTYEELVAVYGAALVDLNAVYVATNNEEALGTSITIHSAVYSVGETTPEETTSDETVPEETTPDETVPEETTPDETVPEETTPEETKPVAASSVTLFSGSSSIGSSWTICTEIGTTLGGGTVDPATLPSNGYIAVSYTADLEGGIYLAMQDATNWGWYQCNEPTSTVASGDGYISYFSNADLVAAYGGNDFSDLGKIFIGSGNATTVTVSSVKWSNIPGSNPATGVLLPVAAAIVGTASILGLGITIHKRKEMN